MDTQADTNKTKSMLRIAQMKTLKFNSGKDTTK